MPEAIGTKLKKFSVETRLESVNKFKDKLLEMFKAYIKAVIVWGSITRGDFTGKSDVDVYILFDDTKMPLKKFNDIRDRIDRDIANVARSIDPRLHPQPVIALTEFFTNVRTVNPFIYNIVREGYAVYDVGFFIPMRKLLEKGEFPITPEAAEMRMEFVPKRISRVKNVKLLMVVDDLYQAMVDAAQAALMFLGFVPSPPKVLVRDVKRHLVEPGLLEEKYAKMLEEMIALRKASEKKEVKELKGSEVDEWIKKTEDFVERIDKLLKKLESERKATDIQKNYEVMIKASVAALKAIGKLPPEPEKLPEAFKKELIDSGLVSQVYGDIFPKVIAMRKALEDKKIENVPDRDVWMAKEYVRRFVGEVRGIIERTLAPETKSESKTEETSKREEKQKKK
ncbi:MAG: nucleotidyltransferase domain-containing protein [Candidatus Aenigmatarchaeota archaeon]